jgi:hypothetical protein
MVAAGLIEAQARMRAAAREWKKVERARREGGFFTRES